MNANLQQNPIDPKQAEFFKELAKMGITPSKSVLQGWNGTISGVIALKQSLERGNVDAYAKANEVLNNKCLELPATKTNTFKADDQNSFDRLSECLQVVHATEMEAIYE